MRQSSSADDMAGKQCLKMTLDMVAPIPGHPSNPAPYAIDEAVESTARSKARTSARAPWVELAVRQLRQRRPSGQSSSCQKQPMPPLQTLLPVG